MAITFEDLELGSVDTGVIIDAVTHVSAFQRAGREVPLPQTGGKVFGITGVAAYGVGEGEEKIAAGSAISSDIGSNKIQSTVVETEESILYHGDRVADILFKQQPSAVARSFDAFVSGLAPVPSSWANFGTLAAATEVEISADQAAGVDLDDAVAALAAGNPTALVLSSAMKAYLTRQRNSVSGARVLEFASNADDPTSGVILDLGIPYYTFTSATRVGFIGNFENFVWGQRAFVGPDGTPWRIHTAGMQTDDNSVEHNLNAGNKVAIQYEQFVGSAVPVLSDFVKIVPGTVVPPVEGE